MGQTSICIAEKRRLCLDTVFFHLGLGKGFIWFYLGLTLDCFSYNFLKFLPQRYCTFNFSENISKSLKIKVHLNKQLSA